MSIKLHDGFMISASSAEQVLDILSDLKQKVRDIALQSILIEVAQSIVAQADHHVFFKQQGDIPDRTSYFMNLIEELSEMESSKTRKPKIDYGFEISLAPLNDTHWLAIPFCEQEYMSVAASMPWYTPYGYWNNTDQPEDVTDEEWAQRYNDWNQLLGPSWVPSEKMFTYQLIPGNFILTAMSHKLDSYAPTTEQRIETLLGSSITRDAMKGVSEQEFMDRFWHVKQEYKPGGSLWPLRDTFVDQVTKYVNDTPAATFLI